MSAWRYFGFVPLILLAEATLHHGFQGVGRSAQLGITTTTTPPSTVSSGNSQELNNGTQTDRSLSKSMEDELGVIKKEIGTIREQVSVWMSDPYNQRIVMPILIGVLSALVTMGLFYLAQRCCRKYQMRRRQSRVINPKEKDAGESQKLISDDEL
ncbi:unnamed protein product, partial [Mesorhabditis belari]|uniref:Uncharacterized protein n=1 Tax=Mesorhabditis belari TaxID=2138241 RepID=A0AAF3FPW8_9BILA